MKVSILGFCYVGGVAAGDLEPDKPGAGVGAWAPGPEDTPHLPQPPVGVNVKSSQADRSGTGADQLDHLIARSEIVLIACEDDPVHECISGLGKRVLIVDLREYEHDEIPESELESGGLNDPFLSLCRAKVRGLRPRRNNDL